MIARRILVALSLVAVASCGPGAMTMHGGEDAAVPRADAALAPFDADRPDPAPADAGAPTDPPDPPDPPVGPGFEAPVDDPCLTLVPTIRGTDGADRLIGTSGPDVIFAGAGDDEIWGNGGDDVICAGGGADRVYGGDGDDYIDAGFGRDFVDGGAGNDILHGRSGGDLLRGGPGDDVLFGDLLDDELYGDEGNDILIGGHGIDHMHGGEGDDWLRGDTNRDEFIGGAGTDTLSFMTATPPGQPLDGVAAVDGVVVDLGAGLASGDGYRETVQGVEVLVGSPFADHLVSGGPVHGGGGADTCAPTPCEPAAPRGDRAFVALATGPIDLGLVVIGTPANDAISITIARGVITVRETNGAPIDAGEGCVAGASASEVRCVLEAELRYVVAWGGDGDDDIALEGGGFPRDMTSTLDGGDGNDRLVGGDGQDILFAGRTGNDTLIGNGGDDALISESTDGDVMDAGGGNDQLVASYPCAGHRFIGGGGFDVGGFARVGTSFDTAAERHRQRIYAQLGFRAYQPAFCAHEEGTQLGDDIEILEGAGGDDVLIGNDRDNVIWGWGGDDVIRGLGGNDVLEGHQGNDTIYGGAGRDRLRGNGGFNVLYASDGERDLELSCGADGRLASADGVDPSASGCR